MLTTLLRNQDDLDLPPDVIRREVAFYLQAGSHSTANAFTHTMDEVFALERRPPGRRRPGPGRPALPAALRP